MFSTFDCDQLAKTRQHGSKPNVSRSILAQRRDLKRAPLKTPAWEASSIHPLSSQSWNWKTRRAWATGMSYLRTAVFYKRKQDGGRFDQWLPFAVVTLWKPENCSIWEILRSVERNELFINTLVCIYLVISLVCSVNQTLLWRLFKFCRCRLLQLTAG